MKELRDIRNDYKPTIIQGLYEETFSDEVIEERGNAYEMIRAFYDVDIFFQFIYSDNFVFQEIAQDDDVINNISERVYEVMYAFYKNNPKLLNEDFTLNNNFYNVNLRLLIVDIESNLREEKESEEK
jgi:hypothetical protein